MYSGGAYQTVPKPMSPVPGETFSPEAGAGRCQGRARTSPTRLTGTPFVETDSTGAGASITFDIPDNLTAWRATARASDDLTTQVGEGKSDVTSTMPLSVRLEMPRFYIDGDEAVVTAIVRNDTPDERTVKTYMVGTGLTLDGATENTVTVAPNSQQQINWRAKVVSDSGVMARIVADGGEGAQDAVELSIPSHAGMASRW